MHRVLDPSYAWIAKDLEILAPIFGLDDTNENTGDATHTVLKVGDGGTATAKFQLKGKAVAPLAAPLDVQKPPTESENPKCDQICTNGSEGKRMRCMYRCESMQKKVCIDKFPGCKTQCSNDVEIIPKDVECEKLCKTVTGKLCSSLGYLAPKSKVSPHHDKKVPPSVEATPPPKLWKGSFVFCNLYPASYEFDVLALSNQEAKTGKKMAKLGYKQCAKVEAQSLQVIGLQAKGVLAAVSKPIDKIPSVMLFGQFAFGNHQIEFNRYFARGSGAYLCNGWPAWQNVDYGEPVTFYRGGYKGKKLATLRYKDCTPTALKAGDVVAAKIHDENAGEYQVTGNPLAVILGKAGQSTGVAFEAWQGTGEVSLEQTEIDEF
jgi:hypothetical protein